uniref:HDC12755 n=1 Tax=Drosophila melanogaster TaxID=7227 RepID=Q6IKE2_DROME|nr:TPA_inf: HDC12755 [Drosophila melanogaster]
MPPFSTCSLCNICFKSTFQEKKQLIKAENLKKNGVAKQPKMKRITCQDKSERIAKKAVDQCVETEKKEKKMRPLKSYNPRAIDPPKVHRMPTITPLLMQTVIIKNRKYVAISETADNE